MLKIPFNKDTFKKSFLSGKGALALTTDNDAWKQLWDSNGKFTNDVDKIADVAVSLGTGAKTIGLGQRNNLKLSVEAGAEAAARVELIWPRDRNSNELIQLYDLRESLTPGKLYVALVLNGSVAASGSTTVPSGTLTASFNAGAGGDAGFTHLRLYDPAQQSAKSILRDFFRKTRLPQRVDTLEEVPQEGEVIELTYGGYLNLGATLNWGYQFNGVRSFEPGDLDLTFSYLVKLASSLSVGYKVAGKHSLIARRGHDTDWVRFIVTKAGGSEFTFAADLGLNADYKLAGLPDTADDFLAAVLGTDVGSALGYLKEARKFDSLDAIKDKLDDLATGFLQDLSQKWLGAALDNQSWDRFFEIAQDVITTYESLDQRLVAIYDQYLDKVPELVEKIDDLAGVTTQDSLIDWVEGQVLAGVRHSNAWELIKDEWGDDFNDILLDSEEFQRLRTFILEAQSFLKSGAQHHINDFATEVKDKLAIGEYIAELKKYSSAAKLKADADARLAAFVDRVLDRSFAKLKGSKLNKQFKRLQTFLKDVDGLKKNWYDKLKGASEGSLAAQVAYNYTRTRANQSLIDIEVNLASATGRKLASAASKGDFARALTKFDPAVVRINEGTRLTRSLQTASRLQVNLFGMNFGRAIDVVHSLDQYTESQAGGLVHVYEIEDKVDVAKQNFRESQKSSLLLQTVATAFQPTGGGPPVDRKGSFLARSLRRMTVSYDMTQADKKTTFKEMRAYLSLAEMLGLIGSAEKIVEQLRDEFPDGLGSVSVDYDVRYEPEALPLLFALDNTAQLAFARAVARYVIAKTFLSYHANSGTFKIGAGYASGRKDDFQGGGTVHVPVPRWLTGRTVESVNVSGAQKRFVWRLFEVEENFLERFTELDTLVDTMRVENRPIPVEKLEKATRAFAKANTKLEAVTPGSQSINVFFVILDMLLGELTERGNLRRSAMVMEITPPNVADEDKVTKYFVEGGARIEEV